MKLNYGLAFYLKSENEIAAIENRLRKYLGPNLIKGKSIIEEIEGIIPKKFYASFLYGLLNEKVIVKENVSQSIEEYIFSFDTKNFNHYFSSQKQATGIINDLEKQFEKKRDLENVELVATFPPSFFKDEVPEIYSTYPSIKRLIVNTKKKLWIINPFFDSFGVEYLTPSLYAAAERGVNIKIITRNFFDEDIGDGVVESLMKLVNKLDEKNLLNMIEMRSFFKKNEFTGKQEYALHSKIILSDINSFYLGSANVTETGLKYNFELGVIIHGSKATRVADVLERLYEISDNIDINQLNYKNY